MLTSLQSITAWMILVLGGLAPGWAMLRGLRLNDLRGVPRWSWALALGWLFWSGVLVGLAHAELLVPEVLGPLSFAAAAGGAAVVVRERQAGGRGKWTGVGRSRPGDALPRRDVAEKQTRLFPSGRMVFGCWHVVAVSAIAVCGMTLAAALAPPTAGDALCYHLNLARRFLEQGRLYYSPWDDNITYPLMVQLWYAWALALGPPGTAALVHWSCGLLLAGATWHLGQLVLGQRWAPRAAALVLLVPGVGNQMGVPLNDLPLALYATLALSGWLQGERAGPRSRGWALAAGLAAGGALAVKYAAALPLLGLGAVAGVGFVAAKGRLPTLRRATAVALMAATVGGYWYVRAAWYRGNPVYPLLVRQLGGSPPPPHQRDKTPLPPTLAAAAAAPWLVTFRPERFGGRGHRPGVLLLALLPGAGLVRLRSGEKRLLVYLGVFLLAWFAVRQNLRFLLPAIPAGVVLATGTLARLGNLSQAARLASAVVLLLAAADALGGAARRASRTWPVVCGVQDRQRYLAQRVPWLPACRMLEESFVPVRVLTTDVRMFPLPGEVVRESVYARVSKYHRLAGHRERIDRLRQDGFTHLLVAGHNRSARRLQRLCRRWARRGAVRLVARSPAGVPPAKRWQLWQLRSSPFPAESTSFRKVAAVE